MTVEYIHVQNDDEGQRIDNYLLRILKGVPKSHIYRIIRSGEVRINKKRAKASTRLCDGDSIRLPPIRTSIEKPPVFVGNQMTERLKGSIIFEDSHLLVLNKPAGIAVHGGSGLSLGVIEAFRCIRKDLPYLELVHRLDKDTSGCLLLAKRRSVLRLIQSLLADRLIEKRYWAILCNPWCGKKTIVVDAALQKNELKSGERIVSVNSMGKSSQTAFQLLENYENNCWVEASPRTGRTHQIRVHSALLGHPILGDLKYGAVENKNNARLYLHARAIQFTLEGKNMCFQAEPDVEFSETLRRLRSSHAR